MSNPLLHALDINNLVAVSFLLETRDLGRLSQAAKSGTAAAAAYLLPRHPVAEDYS